MRRFLLVLSLGLLALLSAPPAATVSAQTASLQLSLNEYRAPQPDALQRRFGGKNPANASRIAQYSFCGACTDDGACGTGNKCCTGNCTGGKKKCYAVSTCP